MMSFPGRISYTQTKQSEHIHQHISKRRLMFYKSLIDETIAVDIYWTDNSSGNVITHIPTTRFLSLVTGAARGHWLRSTHRPLQSFIGWQAFNLAICHYCYSMASLIKQSRLNVSVGSLSRIRWFVTWLKKTDSAFVHAMSGRSGWRRELEMSGGFREFRFLRH